MSPPVELAVALRRDEVEERLAPWLPPEAPLAMPVQALETGTLAAARAPSTPPAIGWRRALVFGGTAALTLLASYQMWWLMRGAGIGVLEGLLLALFVPLFAWIALSFMGALAGFARIRAVLESVIATGKAAHFDCFILSDTRDPDIAAAEEGAFLALRAQLGEEIGVYYRRRRDNRERKAGNIAGWVRRFGGAFAHM